MGYIRSWRRLSHDIRRILRTRQEVRYANLHSNILLLETTRSQTAEEFWGKFEEALNKSRLYIIAPENSDIIPVPIELCAPTPGVERWALYHLNETERYDWPAVAQCYVWPFEIGVKEWGVPASWDIELVSSEKCREPEPGRRSRDCQLPAARLIGVFRNPRSPLRMHGILAAVFLRVSPRPWDSASPIGPT